MRSLNRVLCPTEIERPADVPLRYASFVAERFGAALDVIHVRAPDPATHGLVFHTPAQARAFHVISDHERHAQLQRVLRDLGGVLPRNTAAHVVDGPPLTGIARSIDRLTSDLIVMDASVPADSGSQFLATLAEQIAQTAPCAVLTVDESSTAPPLRLRRILLPIDFSPATPIALGWAAAFARRFDASIELLHVRQAATPELTAEQYLECFSPRGSACRASALLERLETWLSEWGAEVADRTVTDGSPFERILERLERTDLVVMSTDTIPSNDGMIGSGVLASVRRRASIPVLSIRGPRGDALLLRPDMEPAARARRRSAALEA
jgi:nucleotide-binding universal stress UspA family protein